MAGGRFSEEGTNQVASGFAHGNVRLSTHCAQPGVPAVESTAQNWLSVEMAAANAEIDSWSAGIRESFETLARDPENSDVNETEDD
jgi:hypothetical protein